MKVAVRKDLAERKKQIYCWTNSDNGRKIGRISAETLHGAEFVRWLTCGIRVKLQDGSLVGVRSFEVDYV